MSIDYSKVETIEIEPIQLPMLRARSSKFLWLDAGNQFLISCEKSQSERWYQWRTKLTEAQVALIKPAFDQNAVIDYIHVSWGGKTALGTQVPTRCSVTSPPENNHIVHRNTIGYVLGDQPAIGKPALDVEPWREAFPEINVQVRNTFVVQPFSE